MVEYWGLPSLFLTLTTDEVSETRWCEIEQIEALIQTMNSQFTWEDCPVECVVVFHIRLKAFLNKYILPKNGILGRVKHYLIRYEIQNRGSAHARIMLWLNEEDVEKVCAEIDAHIPYIYDWEKYPDNSKEKKLHHLVIRKQMHKCTNNCNILLEEGKHKCKYGFPFPIQTSIYPLLDEKTQRWTYYRPTSQYRNIVPYHAGILLLWKAHMNIQRVTNTGLSYYLLKYAMKTEPIGKLNLNINDAAALVSSFTSFRILLL